MPDLFFSSSPSSSTIFTSSPSRTPPDSPLSRVTQKSGKTGLDLLLSAVDVANRKQLNPIGAWEGQSEDEEDLVHIDDDDDETEDEAYPTSV